jgi:hypothetical protein
MRGDFKTGGAYSLRYAGQRAFDDTLCGFRGDVTRAHPCSTCGQDQICTLLITPLKEYLADGLFLIRDDGHLGDLPALLGDKSF